MLPTVSTVDGVQEVMFRDRVIERNAEYGFDENGKFGIINGEITVSPAEGGYSITVTVMEGEFNTTIVQDNNSNVVASFSANSDSGIYYNSETETIQDADLEISDGSIISLEDGFIGEYEYPVLSGSLEGNPFHLGLTEDDEYLLADLGLTFGDFEGIIFGIKESPDYATLDYEFKLAEDADSSKIQNLIEKVRDNTGYTIQESLEILYNTLTFAGPRTNQEILEHKNAEVQKMKDNPNKVYIVHNMARGAAYYATRGLTRMTDDTEVYNHSAIAFQHTDGQIYVIDMVAGGSENRKIPTDLRILPIDKWKDDDALDILAQELPLSASSISKIVDGSIFGSYIDRGTMDPKAVIKFDLGSILLRAFPLDFIPISDDPNSKFCSELVYDILHDSLGLEPTDYNHDDLVDPNELRHYINQLLQQGIQL